MKYVFGLAILPLVLLVAAFIVGMCYYYTVGAHIHTFYDPVGKVIPINWVLVDLMWACVAWYLLVCTVGGFFYFIKDSK